MRIRILFITTLLLASGVTAIRAQTLPPDTLSRTIRERAQPPYKAGLDAMRREDYPSALKEFQTAAGIDQGFEMAHYMMGRAHLALRMAPEERKARAELLRTLAAARKPADWLADQLAAAG